MDLELDPDPEVTLYDQRWYIDGTGAGVDPKLRSKDYNQNMDLEVDPDPVLTDLPTSAKVRHRWEWNRNQSWL